MRFVLLMSLAVLPAAAAEESPLRFAETGLQLAGPVTVAPIKAQGNVTEIRFSVPYSFVNVPKQIDFAYIGCYVGATALTTLMDKNMISHGHTKIDLNGADKSASALVVVGPPPDPKHTLADAKFYLCGIAKFNDGSAKCEWESKPCGAQQPGSVRLVTGTIP